MDAMEFQDVSIADIPRAFRQTDYEKGDVHIKTEGDMVNLLKYIYPAYYKECVYIDIRGNKCMYEEAKKDIYDTIDVSLLFRKKSPKS